MDEETATAEPQGFLEGRIPALGSLPLPGFPQGIEGGPCPTCILFWIALVVGAVIAYRVIKAKRG